MIEIVCSFQQVYSIKHLHLSNLSRVHISDVVLESFVVNPIWHNEPLFVWASNLVLILIDHLIFLKSFLEVLRSGSHNNFMACEFFTAQFQDHVTCIFHLGVHKLERVIGWELRPDQKFLQNLPRRYLALWKLLHELVEFILLGLNKSGRDSQEENG